MLLAVGSSVQLIDILNICPISADVILHRRAAPPAASPMTSSTSFLDVRPLRAICIVVVTTLFNVTMLITGRRPLRVETIPGPALVPAETARPSIFEVPRTVVLDAEKLPIVCFFPYIILGYMWCSCDA